MDNNISKMLHDQNMTQAALARKVEVKREYINRITHKHIIPGISLGIRIARALGKPVEEVFTI